MGQTLCEKNRPSHPFPGQEPRGNGRFRHRSLRYRRLPVINSPSYGGEKQRDGDMSSLLVVVVSGLVVAIPVVSIVENPAAEKWFATVDNGAPGATQSVETISEPGRTWLKWTVLTNTDGQFTGYGIQQNVRLDLSGVETLRWRWMTSGRYLQLQFWAGNRLAFWDTASLPPGQWKTETVPLSRFHFLGGFEPGDWARITRIGLRIADCFAGYQEGTRYEIGLAFVHGYYGLGQPGPRPPAPAALTLRETNEALSVGSDRYRVELSKHRLVMQLFLPGENDLLAASPSGLFWGFDVEKGRSFDAAPVYQVIERSPQRIILAAAAEFPLPDRDAILITFLFLPDRFYTTVKYCTPLDTGYVCTRFAPSGDAVKGLFDHYAFRDDAEALHIGSFAEYEPRAGFGVSTFDTDGDFLRPMSSRGLSATKPYLYLWKEGAGRGLATVYLGYADLWRWHTDNCHFCYYTPTMDYFHLGLGNAPDCHAARSACFYIDRAGDPALIDQVVVPEILAQASTLPLDARVPAGFTIRTDTGETARAVLAKLSHTWGNHMHWIGCGWGNNGDDVLASSVDLSERMLEFGAAGGVNFDMVGVERLATERPAALEKLRRLLATGRLEVLGGTYGQPLGSLHGAEANVRQLQWGVRVSQQCLGVTPKIFWEEEFYFFPQLPQLLRLMGFEGACLYFQRTWMTPYFPREQDTSVVAWEGPDGSRLRSAAATAITRWMPSRFDPVEVAKTAVAQQATQPLIVDWNELAGSFCEADWYKPVYESMTRFGIKPTTLSDYLASYDGPEPTRAYRMDETFVGLPWGKCGDQVRRADKRIENTLTAAEALAAAASVEGLPYPTDVLTEAWKNLLIFQGHDVHICEGVLRHAYPRYMQAAEDLAQRALQETATACAQRVDTRHPGALAAAVVFNSLPWPRSGPVEAVLPEDLSLPGALAVEDTQGRLSPAQRLADGRLLFVARHVPALGYQTFWLVPGPANTDLKTSPDGLQVENSVLRVEVDASGAVRSLRMAGGQELLSADTPNGELRATIKGTAVSSSTCGPSVRLIEAGPVRVMVEATGALTAHVRFSNRVIVYSGLPWLVFETDAQVEEELDGMMTGSLRRVFTPAFTATYYHDWPFGVSETAMTNEFRKSFPFRPTGREDVVRNHVTGLNLLDCQGSKVGLLYVHDGNQAFLRDGALIANILSCYDPWDEGYYPTHQSFRSALIAHGPWLNSDRLRAAIEFNTAMPAVVGPCREGPWPASRSWLEMETPGVMTSAFYRDGAHLFLRLYDVDGQARQVLLRPSFRVASAELVNLRGDTIRPLTTENGAILLDLRPYQIATIRITPAPP